jgi:hypothetical protein
MRWHMSDTSGIVSLAFSVIGCKGTKILNFALMKNQSHETKVVLAFAAVYIVWGSSFFGVHLALKSFPPFLLPIFGS